MNRKEEEREISLIVGYIMYNDLLEGTEFDGTFWSKIDHVQKIAEAFVQVYPWYYTWGEEEDFEETLEWWVKDNAKLIITNNKIN